MTIVSPPTLDWHFSLSPQPLPAHGLGRAFKTRPFPDPKYSRCITGQNNSLRASIHAFLAQGRAVSTHHFLLPDSCLCRPVYVNSAACARVSTYTLTHVHTHFFIVFHCTVFVISGRDVVPSHNSCGDGENCLINVLHTRHGEILTF